MKLSKLRAAHASREVAGTSIPRTGATSKGLKAAMKKGGHAFAGDSGEVDGEHAKHRLDRPGRKHGGKVHHMEHHKMGGHVKHHDEKHEHEKKHGGLACKKDGGGIRDGDGDSEKAAELKKHSKMEAYAEHKHGGKVKEHHEKKEHHAHGGHVKMHHEKHEHEDHHKHGGHVKKKMMAAH